MSIVVLLQSQVQIMYNIITNTLPVSQNSQATLQAHIVTSMDIASIKASG